MCQDQSISPKVCGCVAERPLGSNELSFHLEPVDKDRVDVVAVGVALQRKCFTVNFTIIL